MRKGFIRILTIGGALAAAVGALAATALSIPGVRKRLQDVRSASEKRMRYEQGRARGTRYRMAGMHPDPNVSDDILADRVRSQIGPIEKRLDLPRVHVTVFDHIAHLHGVVGTVEERLELERAVQRVSGINGIESYLHIGFGRGDTRPSDAMWHPEPSRQLRQLLNAARGAGAPPTGTWLAVRAVLSTFTDRIPLDEREHVFAHLPTDVVGLAAAPHRIGLAQPRTMPQLIQTVQFLSGLTQERAAAVTEAVIATLRSMVPEEVADVTATLPHELQDLWQSAVPVSMPPVSAP